MPHAPNYTPITSFADDETNQASGRSTVRTQKVDDELANLEITVNGINTNLKKLQRDDGRLLDLSVEPYTLSEQTKSLLATKGDIRGLWQPDTNYKVGDIAQYITTGFAALFNHKSSGSFDVNLWLPLSGDGTATIKAIEASASAANALISANNADNSEAIALAAQEAAEVASDSAQSFATTATNASSVADSAKNTALSAANSAQANANSAAASATAADDSADLAFQYSLLATPIQYAVTTGTSSAYEAALIVPIVAYADEQTFKFKFDEACADNATLRISGVNPPLNLKIQASDGAYVNVAANDILANHVTFGLVIEGGTALLIQPATSLTNISNIVANTTFNVVNSYDRNVFSNGTNLTHTLPALSSFPVGGSFTVYSESPNCTIQRAGADTIRSAGASVTSVILNQGDLYEFVATATGWIAVYANGSNYKVGYGVGAGGSVTQITSKATPVTLNKRTGRIITAADAIAGGAAVFFLVNSNQITANDIPIAVVSSNSNYLAQAYFAGSGQFGIRLTNLTGGSLSDAVTIMFGVMNGAIA